ncbi:MAG: retron St85 family RNA-directed DNA polymerase [Xanthomonadales bacterium]|nr:retron St85 family RNA-directed DNA polymerase [Xanthomonadales bacterium]
MKNADLERALSAYLRIKPPDLRQIVRTAPYRYKHYQIDKRNGGKRDIFHPSPELKAIQRWLVENVLLNIPVSPSAMGYEKGCSIRDHARQHLQSNYFTKLDFSNFFPSIQLDWITRFLLESLPDYDNEAIHSIARLACRWADAGMPLALSIGAPSSPALSNRIMFALDTALSEVASANDVTYSRYADDIYFSCAKANTLHDLEREARKIIIEMTPALRLNEQKTLHTSRKRKVLISGVGITSTRKLSIGRNLKRSIRTQVFLWSMGSLPAENFPKLRGLLNFANDIEPEFLASLHRKFGDDLIKRFLAGDFERN